MITTCKRYITDNHSETIWTLPQNDLRDRIQNCLKLNEEYQQNFHLVKKKLEKDPSKPQFDFSEVYIFGKFESFARRLKKIIEMFDIINIYSHLSGTKIEGKITMYLLNSLYCLSIIKLYNSKQYLLTNQIR